MKTANFKTVVILLLIVIFSYNCYSQNNNDIIKWSFKTNDRIYSHPITENGIIYFGSNDDKLYAVNAVTGKEIWNYQTNYNIQSSPIIKDSKLYFYSGNKFYSLNKNTGKEIWSYTNESIHIIEKLDPWDYHHGSPVINDTSIYWACGDGNLYSFNLSNGKLNYFYSTIDSAAIKCTPIINNNILYFGDWNGRVYALDSNKKDTLWTYKTYIKQPYPTFGQINSMLYLHDSLLFFGARNPELNVININSGALAWRYKVKEGGWISGDPLVVGDTLFIGGSDCHKLFAFNVNTGENYWIYEFLNNNFSKPLKIGNYIIFTTGDAYANNESNYGRGYLYAVNKNDGSIVNFSLIGGNSFTSPVHLNNTLITGSDDNHLYAINLKSFLSDSTNLKNKGYNSFSNLEISPNPFQDTTIFRFSINYKTKINATIYDLKDNEIKKILNESLDQGIHLIKWDGKDKLNNEIPKGYYKIEMNSGIYFRNSFILKN